MRKRILDRRPINSACVGVQILIGGYSGINIQGEVKSPNGSIVVTTVRQTSSASRCDGCIARQSRQLIDAGSREVIIERMVSHPYPNFPFFTPPPSASMLQQLYNLFNIPRQRLTCAILARELSTILKVEHPKVTSNHFVALRPLKPEVARLRSAHTIWLAEQIVLWSRSKLEGDVAQRRYAVKCADDARDVRGEGENAGEAEGCDVATCIYLLG